MQKTNSTVILLIILDGLGYSKNKKYNAIYHAATPHFDQWMQEYPHAFLKAAGPAVGLPEKTIGNSEAGHLTIGAGRITKEPVTRINDAIDNGSFAKNPVLLEALNRMDKNKTLHFIGLLSDAGVHSHMKQLNALLDIAHQQGFKHIVVHPILDGRDVPPQSAGKYLKLLDEKLKKIDAKIGSIHGRFYAMDRDKNWDRIEQSYKALTQPQPRMRYQ
jgi:2,3-bisphosphoglycerate-independent phosphoglycerate mutase